MPPSAQPATVRKIALRLLPFLFLLYIVAFLDRVNVSFAGLDMTRDLNFSDRVFGLGAGIFFIGYMLFEIPGALLVERWSARKVIARILVTWGIVTVLVALVRTPGQFYVARFLLGAAEAGFFPGVLVYLTHWFRYEDRAKAAALFMAAIPVANVIGSPLAGATLNVDWGGWPGWRWLFVLEGIPAVVLGIVTIYFLPDWPGEAKWLAGAERVDYSGARPPEGSKTCCQTRCDRRGAANAARDFADAGLFPFRNRNLRICGLVSDDSETGDGIVEFYGDVACGASLRCRRRRDASQWMAFRPFARAAVAHGAAIVCRSGVSWRCARLRQQSSVSFRIDGRGRCVHNGVPA